MKFTLTRRKDLPRMGALKGIFLEARAAGSVVVMECAALLKEQALCSQIMGIPPAWFDTLEDNGPAVCKAVKYLKVGESVTIDLE